MKKTEITLVKYVSMNSKEKMILDNEPAPGSADVRIEVKISSLALWSRLGLPNQEQIIKVADAVDKMIQGKIEE